MTLNRIVVLGVDPVVATSFIPLINITPLFVFLLRVQSNVVNTVNKTNTTNTECSRLLSGSSLNGSNGINISILLTKDLRDHFDLQAINLVSGKQFLECPPTASSWSYHK